MKCNNYILAILVVTVLCIACSNNSSNTNATPSAAPEDSLLRPADTVPTGRSSSPSEFNKGNSSPPGSTGGADSTLPTEPRNSDGRN